MMKFLRSQSQTVLIVVLGVIGLGFLFYGNSGNLLSGSGGHVSSDYGRIDGGDLNVYELTDAIRNTRYAFIMEGHAEALRQPGASEQIAQEAWRQLLLLREADRLHIQISNKELIDYLQSQPVFQKDGAYSPDAYRTWLMQQQIMLHLQSEPGADALLATEAAVETVMRNTLRTKAVFAALFSTARISGQDVSDRYEKVNSMTGVSLVTFDSKSFVDAAQITPDEIQAEYKNSPQNPAYRTKEKRKVDYVLLSLPPDQVKLPDAQKKAALEALGEKALDFALAFQPEPTAAGGSPPSPPDFITEAKKRGLEPVTSDFFTADTPPANLPPSPSFNNAAFELTKDSPISKVIEMDNAVAVIHLVEIEPSDLLPLDQVTAGITQKLRESKGTETAELAADNAAKALQAAVAKGTDFKTAAAAMNLKVETIPPFVPMKAPETDQRLQTIAYEASKLSVGQVSGSVPLQSGDATLVLHLDSRAKGDPAGLAEFETHFRQSQDDQLSSLVYMDWANWMSKQSGTHKPPDLDAFGGAE